MSATMKKTLLVLLILFLSGCATQIKHIKPDTIYILDDGSKIKVYSTPNERIYQIEKEVFIDG